MAVPFISFVGLGNYSPSLSLSFLIDKMGMTDLLMELLNTKLVNACKVLAAAAESLQSCLTLCDLVDGSPPGSSVHESLQARILEWVTTPSSQITQKWAKDLKKHLCTDIYRWPIST